MKNGMTLFVALLLSLLAGGCSGDEPFGGSPEKQVIGKTVVVVLPSAGGLDAHWKRVFTLLGHNIGRAFAGRQEEVRLDIEFHDETTENLEELSQSLAMRDDVYAVIGGLYSRNARTLAMALCRADKTFFTLATTEELVRGFASSGNLWAMTETDITQSEVLLSKVVNYGGKSVSLIADGSAPYGKTFVDWFAFQAKELGLAVRGIYDIGGGSVGAAARSAAMSGVDYVICAPEAVADVAAIVDVFSAAGVAAPGLLFSDIAYGADVIESLGSKAEGLEGVSFGADPEAGFDVSYRTFFGVAPTSGAAQLYDAGMLLAYAAWYQALHPGVPLRTALRAIVDGRDFNVGSWMGEDMRHVVDALARGRAPYVRGASGWLDFDSKIYTNVLSTTYYNYKVYAGRYVILDYNTADGGNRTEATLAGWNWKASQMQSFDPAGTDVRYAPLTGNQALLVATSCGWANYRHQADVLAMYRLLKRHGYGDDRIILIMADDIACNAANPEKGAVRVTPDGENLYRDVSIDYKLSELGPQDFCNILSGKPTAATPTVLAGGEGTNTFVFISGHGVPKSLCWADRPNGIAADDFAGALSALKSDVGYRKVGIFIEACYSGGIGEACEGLPGTIVMTAAGPDETSKADVFSPDLGIWMSNRFSSTMIESMEKQSFMSLHELYRRLFLNTVGSHVTVYNAENYGNLYHSFMDEFINPTAGVPAE